MQKWIATLLAISFFGIGAQAQTWTHSTEADELRAKNYEVFRLKGEFAHSPGIAAGVAPAIVAYCSNGKLDKAYVEVGVVAQVASDAYSLKGNVQARVDMRIDDRKPTDDFWETSNDGTALFIDRIQLNELLTGRALGHPANSASLSRRVLLGVTEAFGNEIVMRFDMPPDPSDLVLTCGLEWNRKLRSNLRDGAK